jgi:hypothetical protein
MILEILLSICVIYILYRWFWPGKNATQLTKEFEKHITNVLADVDGGDFNEEEEVTKFSVGPGTGRFQAKVVLAAKAEFGLLQRSNANRLMVRKFMRDLMRDHKMRPSHIHENIEICVAMFFIPTKHDINAYKVGATLEAITRDNDVHTWWESFYGPLGRMLGFSQA